MAKKTRKPKPRLTRDWTVQEVKACHEPGLHRVSRNLYIYIAPSGSKSWVFRYIRNGIEHRMGIGSVDVVSLAAARDLAVDYRRPLYQSVDPLEQRRTAGQSRAMPKPKGNPQLNAYTFEQIARVF